MAREQDAGVGLMEKDYVNGWILGALFTSSFSDQIIFKGGTALSKVYFPERWRFSEDLDFTVTGQIDDLETQLKQSLSHTSDLSGIGFRIRDSHHNPDYSQLKVQYDAILQQKNTTNLDFFRDELVYFPVQEVAYSVEDLPEVKVRVYSLEEIFVEKLRSLFQRARARDYFDLYWLIELKNFDQTKIREALSEKAKFKGISITKSNFPDEEVIEEVRNYWDRALDRFTSFKPDFAEVVRTIRTYMEGIW